MKKKDELPVSICVLGISSHDGNELLLTYYKKREDQIRGGMGSEGEIRGGIRGGWDQRERSEGGGVWEAPDPALAIRNCRNPPPAAETFTP